MPNCLGEKHLLTPRKELPCHLLAGDALPREDLPQVLLFVRLQQDEVEIVRETVILNEDFPDPCLPVQLFEGGYLSVAGDGLQDLNCHLSPLIFLI